MKQQQIIIILPAFFLFSCVDPNINKTYYIPEDYSTIQEVIDVAIAGDKIIVDPGIYIENLNFFGKTIKLKSNYQSREDTLTISQTIIDAGYANHAINLSSGEKIISLSGFTIRNGIAGGGGAIAAYDSNIELVNCNFLRNEASHGGAIYSSFSDIKIKRTLLDGNHASRCGAI